MPTSLVEFIQNGIVMSIKCNNEGKWQVIFFHYRIYSDRNTVTFQKFNLECGSEDMTSAMTMLVDFGRSSAIVVVVNFCLLDRRFIIVDNVEEEIWI